MGEITAVHFPHIRLMLPESISHLFIYLRWWLKITKACGCLPAVDCKCPSRDTQVFEMPGRCWDRIWRWFRRIQMPFVDWQTRKEKSIGCSNSINSSNSQLDMIICGLCKYLTHYFQTDHPWTIILHKPRSKQEFLKSAASKQIIWSQVKEKKSYGERSKKKQTICRHMENKLLYIVWSLRSRDY